MSKDNAHAFILTFVGAQNLDEGVTFAAEEAAPPLRQQKGYRGLTASVDRAGGVIGMLSLWERPADRDAAESVLAKIGDGAHGLLGGEVVIENYERLVADVARRPTVGAAVLLTPIRMDPARIDENVASFTSTLLPQIKAKPGYCALFLMMNRQTGQGVVSKAWVDEAARESAEADSQPLRGLAAADGVTCGGVSRRTVEFIELR